MRKKGPHSAADKEEAERLKTEGNNLMRTEKFQEALDMYTKAVDNFKKALELEPDNESYKSHLLIAQDKVSSEVSPCNAGFPGMFPGMGGPGGEMIGNECREYLFYSTKGCGY